MLTDSVAMPFPVFFSQVVANRYHVYFLVKIHRFNDSHQRILLLPQKNPHLILLFCCNPYQNGRSFYVPFLCYV